MYFSDRQVQKMDLGETLQFDHSRGLYKNGTGLQQKPYVKLLTNIFTCASQHYCSPLIKQSPQELMLNKFET